MTRFFDALLMQVPPVPPPPEDIQSGPGGLYAIVIGIAVGVLVLALLLVAIRRSIRRRRAALEAKAPAPALPEERPELEVELPPSEAELAKRREAEEARIAAEELRARRQELAEQAKVAADAAERARIEAEVRALKEREEERKREEYRAKKALEAEERERKKREAEEAARLKAEAEARAAAEEEERKRREAEEERRRIEAEAGRTLAEGLDKTRTQGFMARLNSLFGAPKRVDESVLAELEEVLFTADIGVKTAARLVDSARQKAARNELSSADRIKNVIRDEVERILDLPAPQSLSGGGPPHVVMVVGVNGSGKTTTIGKLAAKCTASGKKVVLAAGDTFRAAATEQLDVWAERAHAELVKAKEDGADPASVVFDAIQKAKSSGADVVIADTAGRLHTKVPLMEELKKVKRVMGKAFPGAPHEVLLVLDSTTGQNAIAQAKQFHEAVGVTAIALTKLDGTAKGGVVIGICDELRIPVVWVGVGEKIADLRPFSAKEFVSALFD